MTQHHLEAIQAGKVTKTNIIGIRKAINHVQRIANGWSGNRSSATAEEVARIEYELDNVQPIVTGELHDSGLAIMRNKRYLKALPECAATVDMFRLIRFDRIGHSGEYAVPVYRAIGPDGAFNFRNIPWQSGGNGPEIVRY